MYKKLTAIIFTCLLLSACQKEQAPEKTITLPEIDLNVITETLSTVTEDAIKDNFDGYEDHTAEILNSFHMNTENPILIPVMLLDWNDPVNYTYDTIDDLCHYSDNIVRGTVIDIAYQTDARYERISYYSVAVSEVLQGETITPNTIITIREDKQGYIPLTLYREKVDPEAYLRQYTKEEGERTYRVGVLDQPLTQTSEEYVFFLSDGTPSEDIIGTYYSVTSGYGGKFKRTEDGLYEKAIPEIMRGLLSQQSTPLSLEELKEQIAKAKRTQN